MYERVPRKRNIYERRFLSTRNSSFRNLIVCGAIVGHFLDDRRRFFRRNSQLERVSKFNTLHAEPSNENTNENLPLKSADYLLLTAESISNIP